MYRVKKRDGELVDFNINKISDAIKKAFEATEHRIQRQRHRLPRAQGHRRLPGARYPKTRP